MKLSDYLLGVGRPVAYYPKLRKITGSTNATIFICQLIYWVGKETLEDGWIYKTSDEIEEETGLSYEEQKTARTRLKSAGLLSEKYARLDHQMLFKVELDALNDKWGNGQPTVPEQGIATMGNKALACSLNRTTEITTENTSYIDDDVQKSISKANVKVDAILKSELDSQKGWPGREKMPEGIRDLLDVFVECTGIKPLRGQHNDWLATGSDWVEIGAQKADIRAAVDKSVPNIDQKRTGFTVGRPGSLTTTIQAVVGERRKTKTTGTLSDFLDKYQQEHGDGD